jgi:regulator of protease activity HflC (stomatin/prohibitin superfamily)
MMTRRRGMRLPREFAFADGGVSHGPRSLRPGELVVVAEWERAVLFREGRVARVLEPGAHRIWQSRCGVRTVDTRPWVITLPTQEAPTADGVPVKVTVAGHARVSDAAVYVTATRVPEQSVYLAVQVAVRELLAATTLADLVGGRAGLGERLTESARDADRAGVAIDELVIKDIILPGELKRAQAEVMIARAQGLAALERARGETAALRGLLNAARLASENPALLQLRLMEHLGTSSGHTVIIGAPPGVVPLPAAAPTVAKPQA